MQVGEVIALVSTGVGKTRLIGSFITYLYTNYNIKNYFVVAPGRTVYEKLKSDLGDPDNPKYVFNGIGCFNSPPQVISNDEFEYLNVSLFESDIKIFVFNIDKFNKENVRMKKINETLGDSFFSMLSNLDDLVLIMDEAHHYHADKGLEALNELKPLFGLELTATPYYNLNNRQVPFKNSVYEYKLSQSISDGYTRTPYAVTQMDVDFNELSSEEIDLIMINDGIICHEKIRNELETFSDITGFRKVKPFMMVVCKDTEHANFIHKKIISNDFRNGNYKNKTLLIHSNQTKKQKEESLKMLQDVENYDNDIEVVIHVDMLKEGWDVNNLYTIVPLRTAASKILREQMVGRGLRLPFGKRVGDRIVDSVMLTAHDKFDELLLEAQKGDSIFNEKNLLDVKSISNTKTEITKLNIPENNDNHLFENETESFKNAYLHFQSQIHGLVSNHLTGFGIRSVNENKDIIMELNQLNTDEKYSKSLTDEENSKMIELLESSVSKLILEGKNKFIPIPKLVITEGSSKELEFNHFTLNESDFNHVPTKGKILVRNLENQKESNIITGNNINIESINPIKEIISMLRAKPEINYEKHSELLFDLINQVLAIYSLKYTDDEVLNIIYYNKKDISNVIFNGMINNCTRQVNNEMTIKSVVGLSYKNHAVSYKYNKSQSLYDPLDDKVNDYLFKDLTKCVFSSTKFDSIPELFFAKVLEQDSQVLKWLRPSINDFNIIYNMKSRYVPDFVFETDKKYYIVEIKGEDRINDVDVFKKNETAIEYCKLATKWAVKNNEKHWEYLFIPSKDINNNLTIEYIISKYNLVK